MQTGWLSSGPSRQGNCTYGSSVVALRFGFEYWGADCSSGTGISHGAEQCGKSKCGKMSACALIFILSAGDAFCMPTRRT